VAFLFDAKGRESVAKNGTHKEFGYLKVKGNCRFLHSLHFVMVGRNDTSFDFGRNAARVRPSSTNLAYSLRVFAKDAYILNAFDSGFSGLRESFVVDYTFLKPEVGDAEADYVFDDGLNLFRGAENVDQVDPLDVVLLGGNVCGLQVGIALEPVHFLKGGIDGENVITLHHEIAADVVAGAPGLVAHADDGNGLRVAEHFVYQGGIVHLASCS